MVNTAKVIFKMKKPCANCPFRKEGAIELREGRLDSIKAGLLQDDSTVFHCHKTIDDPNGKSMCMGAAAWLKSNGRPNVLTRVALIIGELSDDDFAVADQIIDHSPNN